MSVIGRLDKQVDEILITPLSRGRRDESGPAAPPSEAEEAPAPAPPVETTDEDESGAKGGELPVWLL